SWQGRTPSRSKSPPSASFVHSEKVALKRWGRNCSTAVSEEHPSLADHLRMLFAVIFFGLLGFAVAGQESCGPNEVWTDCTSCELKCGESEDTMCEGICNPPSCECSPSRRMRRTEDGRCVLASQCPKKNAKKEAGKCEKPNEQWSKCRGCEGTCAQRFVPCTRNCRPPGCECIASAGFVRDAQGNCIKFEDCPK
ncbi:Trypsin inhibitor, partial [Toxocara canis]